MLYSTDIIHLNYVLCDYMSLATQQSNQQDEGINSVTDKELILLAFVSSCNIPTDTVNHYYIHATFPVLNYRLVLLITEWMSS